MCYFSRKGFDHAQGRAFNAMDNVVKRQLLHEEVVLDGELLVWNKKRCVQIGCGSWGRDDVGMLATHACTQLSGS